MKIFSCKICRKRKKRFFGNRGDVRHHIRHEHLIKSRKIKGISDKHKSKITPNMESYEIDD